jgi:inhibitor of KinA sporulation pathway (predicted exonuclease)
LNNLIVLDLEATCDEPQFDRNQMEIIEIGACLVNAELKVVEKFQTFVRPVVQPQLSAFCTQLTSITQQDVECAPGFVEAIALFEAWIARCREQFGAIDAWGSWGDYDRKQFERNAHLVNAPMPAFLAMQHINFKARYGKVLGLKDKGAGLGKALRYENLAFEGTAHRGIDDALNIARLLPVALGHRESVWRDRPVKQTR